MINQSKQILRRAKVITFPANGDQWDNYFPSKIIMAYEALTPSCVHKLVNNLNLFEVATEVFSDYKVVAAVLKDMGALSTDNFF